MPITLTSDPIVTEQVALDILGWTSADKVRLAINSVSERFKQYTGRLRITSGSVTERQCGRGQDHFWLHATPVTAVSSLTLYADGAVYETVASTAYTYNGTTGRVFLHGTTAPYSDGEQNVVVVYTGGWSTVPGDIVQSALALMKLDDDRLNGRIGVRSEGRDGFTASYEQGDLPESVQRVWSRYRFTA